MAICITTPHGQVKIITEKDVRGKKLSLWFYHEDFAIVCTKTVAYAINKTVWKNITYTQAAQNIHPKKYASTAATTDGDQRPITNSAEVSDTRKE